MPAVTGGALFSDFHHSKIQSRINPAMGQCFFVKKESKALITALLKNYGK
jgi:hypothetical protein